MVGILLSYWGGLFLGAMLVYRRVKNLFSFPWDAGTWPNGFLSPYLFRCWCSDFRYLMTGTFPFNFLISHGAPAFVAFWIIGAQIWVPAARSCLKTADCAFASCRDCDLRCNFFEFFWLSEKRPWRWKDDEKQMPLNFQRSSCKGICILSSSSTTCKIYTVFWMNVAEIPTLNSGTVGNHKFHCFHLQLIIDRSQLDMYACMYIRE